jgi:hypothetical protein
MLFLVMVWLFCDKFEFEPLLLEDDDPPCKDELELLVNDNPPDKDRDFCPPFVSATCCWIKSSDCGTPCGHILVPEENKPSCTGIKLTVTAESRQSDQMSKQLFGFIGI